MYVQYVLVETELSYTLRGMVLLRRYTYGHANLIAF